MSQFEGKDPVPLEVMSSEANSVSSQSYLESGPDRRNENTSLRAYITVGVLFFINLINYMDRFTVAGVLRDVKKYYSNLNDAEAGLLQTAFVVSYMIMAPVFGYMGDRYSRKIIMAFGIFFWSSTTLLGSIPPKAFLLFLFLRALVGTGEASYSTIAPTVIGDLFTGNKRSNMLALFYFAIPVGSGLGYIVGSKVASLFHHWYWALRVTPGLGAIAFILIIIILKDPPRGMSEGGVGLKSTDLKDDIKALIKNRSFIWSTLGFTCVTFTTGALAWWAPTYMAYAIEVSGSKADEDEIGFIFGAITCAAGIVGILCGAGLSQFCRRYSQRADPIVCAFGMLASIPLLFIGCIVAHKMPTLSWVLFFFGETLICLNWSIVADMLMYIIIPTRRATASALQILTSHALGDAASPYIVGTISDAITQQNKTAVVQYTGLQYAMYLPVILLALGALFFFIMSWYIEEDRRRCTQLTQGGGNITREEIFSDQSLPSVVQNEDVVPWSDDTTLLIN